MGTRHRPRRPPPPRRRGRRADLAPLPAEEPLLRSLQPLARLVRRARSEGSPAATPGWLRFAAVLLGGDAEATTATDAADFAEASDQGWRTTLDIAREQRRPEALRAMWPGLWRAARGDRALGEAVAGLVPVEGRHDGAVAADADLFCAATGTGGPGMPAWACSPRAGSSPRTSPP